MESYNIARCVYLCEVKGHSRTAGHRLLSSALFLVSHSLMIWILFSESQMKMQHCHVCVWLLMLFNDWIWEAYFWPTVYASHTGKRATFTDWFCAWESCRKSQESHGAVHVDTSEVPRGEEGNRKKQRRRLCSKRMICIHLQWEMVSSAYGTSSETLHRTWLACLVRRPALLAAIPLLIQQLCWDKVLRVF